MCSTAICKPLNFTIVSLWCNINLLLFYTYRVSSHAWTSWRTVSVMYKEYLSCQTNLQWAPCILCCLLLFRLSRPHSHTVRSVNELQYNHLHPWRAANHDDIHLHAQWKTLYNKKSVYSFLIGSRPSLIRVQMYGSWRQRHATRTLSNFCIFIMVLKI